MKHLLWMHTQTIRINLKKTKKQMMIHLLILNSKIFRKVLQMKSNNQILMNNNLVLNFRESLEVRITQIKNASDQKLILSKWMIQIRHLEIWKN